MNYQILHGDNLEILKDLQKTHTGKISLVFLDPPFNTKHTQVRKQIEVQEDQSSNRVGFNGKKYSTIKSSNTSSYEDKFEDYEGFLIPRIKEMLPLLTDNGSIFVHLGIDEIHYIKVALDKLIGRDNFKNQIVWTWDYGAKSKTKYSNKCDYILWYAKDPKNYIWNYNEVDRIPYKAPKLAGAKKAALGKKIVNCWDMSIEGTSSNIRKEYNYPSMKPIKLLDRIVRVHSNVGDITLDPFAGSGVLGHASLELKRNTIAIDSNIDSINIMTKRFSKYDDVLNKVI